MKKPIELNMEYDVEHNLAYISLRPDSFEKHGVIVRWLPIHLPMRYAQNIVFDFDVDGRLLGIELLKASEQLHPHLVTYEGIRGAMIRVNLMTDQAEYLPRADAVDALRTVHRISSRALGQEVKEV